VELAAAACGRLALASQNRAQGEKSRLLRTQEQPRR
jgi:hypothetical protein